MGYCPDCHEYITDTGECDEGECPSCGYTKASMSDEEFEALGEVKD